MAENPHRGDPGGSLGEVDPIGISGVMCNRARMSNEPETRWGSAAKLFGERPRDNRFDPRELRARVRALLTRVEMHSRRGTVIAVAASTSMSRSSLIGPVPSPPRTAGSRPRPDDRARR